MGIEPTRPAWKAGILAIELHPQATVVIISRHHTIVNTLRQKNSFDPYIIVVHRNNCKKLSSQLFPYYILNLSQNLIVTFLVLKR